MQTKNDEQLKNVVHQWLLVGNQPPSRVVEQFGLIREVVRTLSNGINIVNYNNPLTGNAILSGLYE